MSSLKLILDGNNTIFRAYHVTKGSQFVNGINISVVIKFFSMLKNYTEVFEPDDIYIVWDKRLHPEGKNFRKELIDYKGHRNLDEDTVNEVFECVGLIELLAEKLGMKNMYPWSLEADDMIAFLTKNVKGRCVVVSSDKDLLQLVSDDTFVFNTTKNLDITLDNFEEFTGVPKNRFLDYKCILGDKSDNINGVVGYGEIKSKKLALSQDWDLLDDDQMAIVERNRKIISLDESYNHSEGELKSYEQQLAASEYVECDEEAAKKVCNEYQLIPLIRHIRTWKALLHDNKLFETWFDLD